MRVRHLRLRNFRNYRAQELELPAGLVALIGDNGQGKTNLLEALCVLATTKSPLVERDRELIFWNEKEARLGAAIELAAAPGQLAAAAELRQLEYSWRLAGSGVTKELRIGGVPQSQLAAWLGQLQLVAFFPHDLTIITGEPGERRRFLNLELGKSRPAYFADSARYRRALAQRNALLKSLAEARYAQRAPLGPAREGLGTLGEWNRQLISYGARIFTQRALLLAELEPLLTAVHHNLSGANARFEVGYVPGLAARHYSGAFGPAALATHNWSAAFESALEANHEADMRRGTTLVGPHRDDLVFSLDGIDLRRYGSQGQQRLAVLALKIALARWISATLDEAPVLLLDDALSELDAERRGRLLAETAPFTQCVLTATDASFVGTGAATVLPVSNGHIAT